MSCYLPMPFAKRARIEIINENDLPILLYFHIDYELYSHSLHENTAYFHAILETGSHPVMAGAQICR